MENGLAREPADADGSETEAPIRRYGLRSASMLVVASMIGSGVFTTTGFLLRDLGSVPAVLAVWILGGVLATAGALAYAELTAALPENGGEYALLSRIYHPIVGFVSGWISLIVGFSAPIAAAAVAFGAYADRVAPGASPTVWALVLIVFMSALHAFGARVGRVVQDSITVLDVVLILVFVVGGILAAQPGRLASRGIHELPRVALSGPFAVGLVYVSFSYSGWNAAAYVAGEVRRPGWTMPRALLLGTGLVTSLYVGLNAVFLMSAPPEALSGELEVGHVAAAFLFGDAAATWVSITVAVGLATTVGALIVTGPRVYERMGRDHPRLGFLSRPGGRREPVLAIALQAVVAVVMVATATFDALLTYIGFTLSSSAALTLAGVFVLRSREPELERPYRTWGHPVTTLLVLALMIWMMVFTLIERPLTSLAGLATIASGLVLYVVLGRRRGSRSEASASS